MKKSILLRSILFAAFICFYFACDVSEPEKVLTARTNKTSYTSSEIVLVNLNNSIDKDIFFQKCGGSLVCFYEKLDSIPSGGWVTFFVCRPIISFELKSGKNYTDTLAFLPGSYRLKYYYDFEDINPDTFQQELLTNTFSVK
jgi:hypothetical protein